MEKTILLIRHGETDWNDVGRIQGWVDIPLNEKGLNGAEKLGEYVKKVYPKIDVFYSSDLKRARQTASPMLKKYKANLIQKKDLREQCFGELEGKTFDELTDEETEIFNKLKVYKDETYQPNNNAESYLTFKNRVVKICNQIFFNTKDKTQAIVTHGGVIKVINTELLKMEDIKGFYAIKNNSLTVISIDNDKHIHLKSFNQSYFLDE